MTPAREVADSLLSRVISREPSRQRVIRPTIRRDDIDKVFVHRSRPVVHRVRRVQRLTPVVQPLLEDDDEHELPAITRQRIVPLQRRERVLEWGSDVETAMRRVEDELAELTTGRVSETHRNELPLDEEVREITVNEVVEDVQPLRRRTLRQPTVVEEVQPIFETVTETAEVGDVEYRDAIPWSEWVGEQGE